MGFVAGQNVVVSDYPTPNLSEEVSVEDWSPAHIEVERLASVAAFVVAMLELYSCSSPRVRACPWGAPGLDTEVPHERMKDSAAQPVHDHLACAGDHDPLVVAACQDVQWEQETVVWTMVETSSEVRTLALVLVVEEDELGPLLDWLYCLRYFRTYQCTEHAYLVVWRHFFVCLGYLVRAY